MNEKKQYKIKNIKERDAIIYKLVDKSNGNFYIGSTINTIKNRLHKHINKELNHTKSSHKIIENNDYEMIILDKMRVDDLKILRLYESFYILIAKKFCKERCLNNSLAYNNRNVYEIVRKRKFICPNCNKEMKFYSYRKHKLSYCKSTNNLDNTNQIQIITK